MTELNDRLAFVSIPLISGHQSGRRREERLGRCGVSIPLISGHQSGRNNSKLAASGYVSIPLISGHQSGPEAQAQIADGVDVSIPLISGHQSGHDHRRRKLSFESLNPFDIRASVRTWQLVRKYNSWESQSL